MCAFLFADWLFGLHVQSWWAATLHPARVECDTVTASYPVGLVNVPGMVSTALPVAYFSSWG
jgi:hypothetical protein